MTGRICEECGKHFISEMVMDKVENIALILAVFFLPLYALSSLVQGWSCLIKAPLYIWLTIAAVKEIRTRNVARSGEEVVFGRKCPSCGEKTADINSPRGEQLLAYWRSPDTTHVPEQTPPSEEQTNSSSDQTPRTAN
jgi:hypothetical protein